MRIIGYIPLPTTTVTHLRYLNHKVILLGVRYHPVIALISYHLAVFFQS